MANKFLGQNNSQKFSKAYDFASGVLSATTNPQEALQKAGVTRADLDKAKKMLNSPMAGMVAKFFGASKDDIRKCLDSLDGLFNDAPPVNLPAEQAPASELERMQANLARLK